MSSHHRESDDIVHNKVMDVTKLPAELVLAVLRYVNREDLKALRLTDKAHHGIATRMLFRQVDITPNTRSFDRARQITSATNLSVLVESLVYHIGVLEEGHGGLEIYKSHLARFGKYDLSNIEDVLWLYSCFLEEIDGIRDFETLDEGTELEELCRDMPNLQAITTVLDEYDPFIPSDDFIGRRTGMQLAASAEGPHCSSLFKAASSKALRSICLHSCSWHCVQRMLTVLQSRTTSLHSLTRLELGLDNGEYLGILEAEKLDSLLSLEAMFNATPDIQSLLLDFDEIPFDADRQELLPIARLIFKHTWSSLTRLCLAGIVATEDGLLEFLENHGNTLRHLHLDDIELSVEEDEEEEEEEEENQVLPGSILSLFQRISTSERLQLKSVTLTGNFSNRLDEAYYVDTTERARDRIIVQLEEWICGRADCPVPSLIMNRVRKSRPVKDNDSDDTSSLSSTSEDAHIAEGFQDESWVW